MDTNGDADHPIVTFYDQSGSVIIGETQSKADGVWQVIPDTIAAKMVLNPQHVGLFRTRGGSAGGDAELWAGTPAEARAKLEEPPLPPEDAFGEIVDVAVDARVLHADGTWC